MMRKIMLTGVMACLSVVLFAQSKELPKLETAVATLHQAMIDANAEKLMWITCDSLSYGHSSGLIEDKAQFLQKLTSGASDFVTIDIKDQAITVSGNAAIVRHTLHAKIADGGKPGEVNLRVMQVWQKEKNTWKLFGRQAVKIQ